MQGLHLTADLYNCRCEPVWLLDADRLGHWCITPSDWARKPMQALVDRFAPEWTAQRSLDRGDAA